MNSTESIQHIVRALRSEMARGTAVRPRALNEAVKRGGIAQSRATAQEQRMEELIARRVKEIDPNDGQKGKKAFRIFLEVSLLNEFGENLINDPGFYQLIDQVHEAMTDEPRLSEAVERAMAQLLAVP